MKSLTQTKQKVIQALQRNQIIYVRMNEGNTQEGLTIIFDYRTHSGKIKNLMESLKAQKFNCQFSFSPETWELALTVQR